MFIKLAILLLAVALLSAILARARVRSITARGLTSAGPGETSGSVIAREILDSGGAAGVDIREYRGMLPDHYDPKKQVLFLHAETASSATATAWGTAAFLAGRALQHRHEPTTYFHRRAAIRTALAGAGLLAIVAVFLAIIQRIPGSLAVIVTGVGWATAQLYNLLTLPIDFAAARRASTALESIGSFPRRGKQRDLTMKVLNTLPLTDFSALLRTFPHLIYNALPFLSRRDR